MNKEGRPENSGYIRIRNVTKLAGVSTATVSRVINNPEMTSEKVRKKVQEVIEEYNYIPNRPVKKIFSETSNTIATFICGTEDPSSTSLIKELNQICLGHNYMFLICDTGNNPEFEKKYLCFCLTNRCAGIILTEGVDSDIFETCRIHIPIVLLDRKTRGKFSSVRSNSRQMMQPTADYLYNPGHRKVAFVGCKTPMDSAISRQNSYIEVVVGKGPPIIQEYIYGRNLQLILQAGSQALNYFLPLPAAPTVIICCNDIIALGALNAAYSLRLEIPINMSIVGFDNAINNLHRPRITTVQQNLQDISLEPFELMINLPEELISKVIEASSIESVIYGRVEIPQK